MYPARNTDNPQVGGLSWGFGLGFPSLVAGRESESISIEEEGHTMLKQTSTAVLTALEGVMNLVEHRIGMRILQLARPSAVPCIPHSYAIPDRVHNTL